MQNDSVFIAGNSLRTIANAFYISIDNKDRDTFHILNGFLYDQLSQCFDHNNQRSFEDFSALFVYYYEYALIKLNTSITYKDIYDVCSDASVRGLKEKVGYGFRLRFNQGEISYDEKKKINRFAKVLLNKFCEIINICLRHKDLAHLPDILNQLDQVADRYNHQISNLKWEIHFKRLEKLSEEKKKELGQLEEKYEIESSIDHTVQLIFKVTLYWSYFLYYTRVISFEELQKIEQIFSSYKGYIEEDFVEDLISLRDFSKENEFVWSRWDYTKRREGQVYSPPSVQYWVTLGSVIYILKNKLRFDFKSRTQDAQADNSFEYLISSMQEIVTAFAKSGFDHWKNVINVSNIEEFQKRIDLLQDQLTSLKNMAVTLKEQTIAELPLDYEYVENFKKIMYEGWEKNNSVHELFNYFNKQVLIEDNDPELKFLQIGVRNQVWWGYKTALIRDPNYNITTIGIETHGQNLADVEESVFLSQIISGDRVEVEDVLMGLDKAISDLAGKGYTATVIVISFDLWYRVFGSLRNEDFQFDWNDREGKMFSDFGGVYKGIPIVQFRSQLMKNSIIIADFSSSFKLEQKILKDAYRDNLFLEINEISKEDAENIIAENPDYWKRGMSNEDANIKLRNSIKVDFYLLENFIIENSSSYTVLSLVS